ncbi:MAG: YicC/YloC family endoribonuclease [Pirellulaceae bacterium]
MLLSMTGHGGAQLRQQGLAVTVEVRTVNNRYYKLALRTSDGYASLEPRVDDLVRQSVRRGTVQVDVRINRDAAPDEFRLNEVALASYLRQLDGVRQRLQLDASIRLEQLLTLPGVVEEHVSAPTDADDVWPLVAQALEESLAGLARMRREEGKAMASDLADNCQLVGRELDQVERLSPGVLDAYRARLTDKLNKMLDEHGVTVQPADLIREVGLLAERSDVSEEIVRLRSHLEQFLAIMESAESNGRKLEFVTQEMFREANTIGSKANDAQIARHVVEIKTAIERIREMIQNVE